MRRNDHFNATALICMFVSLLFGSFASADALDDIKSRGTITVGTIQDFPPFGLLDASGNPAGYDIDVAKLFAKYLGVDANIIPLTGANRIPFLLSGKVDMLASSLAITPERAKQIAFSQPYVASSNVVYARKELPIKGMADLVGVTVSVGRANAIDIWLTREAPQGTEIQRYDDEASAYQSVLSGQADAAGVSSVAIPQLEARDPTLSDRFEVKFVLNSQVHGIGVRKEDTRLLSTINEFLDKAKNSGELNAIHREWLKEDLKELTVK